MGNATYLKYNVFGKISETVTPGDDSIPSNRTIYQYDLLGNFVYSRDSLGAATAYTYDSFGRNNSITVSDEAGEHVIKTYASYDLYGNVLS